MTKLVKKNTISVKKVKAKSGIKTKVKNKVSPLLKTTVNTEEEPPTPILKPRAVTTGVYALLEVIKLKENEEKKKALFKNDPKDIFLQIIPIKVPVTEMQQIRVVLPHPLTVEGSDVCLITLDVKKATKGDHEPTIAYYKSLLQEQKVKGISEIVPMRQLRSEQVLYEEKGRFADMYDRYLVDGRLFGKVTKLLGSRFFKKNKPLIPVKINTDNVKRELERALAKTVLTVHGHGDCYSVRVGFSSFSVEQIQENIFAVAAVIADSFPGGLVNVRKMLVKSDRSIAIPIYLSLTPHNSVPVPIVKPRLPKAYAAVEGELSTFVGRRVTVLPTGEVHYVDDLSPEDREMGFGEKQRGEAAAEQLTQPEEPVQAKGVGKGGKQRKMAADTADSSDEDVEAAEDAYVMELAGPAKSVGKADSKSKQAKLSSKAKKRASLVEKGEAKSQHSVASDKTPGVSGVKRKSATPGVKPAKLKKLPEPEVKVKGSKAEQKTRPEKAAKKTKPKEGRKTRAGNVGTPLEQDANVVGSPDKPGKLLESPMEVKVSTGRPVKAKHQAVAVKGSKKPMEEGQLKSRQAARKTTRNIGKATTEATSPLNHTVKEQKKTPKVPKKTPNRESSRFETLSSKLEKKNPKPSIFNEVDFAAQPKLDSPEFITPVIAKSTDKKTKKGDQRRRAREGGSENSFVSLKAVGSAAVETNTDRKKMKQDRDAASTPSTAVNKHKKSKKADKQAANVFDTSTKSVLNLQTSGSPVVKTDTKKKKLTPIGKGEVNAVLASLDFRSPSTQTNTEKKRKKRDKHVAIAQEMLANSVPPFPGFGSPAFEMNSEKKKKKREKLATITNDQDATPVRPSLTPVSPAFVINSEKKKKKREKLATITNDQDATPVRPSSTPVSPAFVINSEKKKREKLVSIGEATSSTHSTPLVAERRAKKKTKKADLDAGTPTIDSRTPVKSLHDGAVGKPTPASVTTRTTRSKREQPEDCGPVLGLEAKSEKTKKRKDKPTTPKLKRKKRDISGDPATPSSQAVLATVKDQTPLSSQKLSKSKDKAKDKKADKKSKTKNEPSAEVHVKKSFPRYFSMENQQTLADYAIKRQVPQYNRDERINTRVPMPHYISVAVKSDIPRLLARARESSEPVTTMPLDLVIELRRRNERRIRLEAQEKAPASARDAYLLRVQERDEEKRALRAANRAGQIRAQYLRLREISLQAERKPPPDWMPRRRDRSLPAFNAQLRREAARKYFHLRRKNDQKLLASLAQANVSSSSQCDHSVSVSVN